MEETRTWEEGRLTINVDFDDKEYDFVGDKNRVDFEVYFPICDSINVKVISMYLYHSRSFSSSMWLLSTNKKENI